MRNARYPHPKRAMITSALIGLVFFASLSPLTGWAAMGDQLFKLTASDAAAGDLFGRSVALFGNTALIGSLNDDDREPSSGSSYLFDITTGQQLRKLTVPDGPIGNQFGHAVALNDEFALIAGRDNSSGGAAYVFNAATGQQLRELTAADGALNDNFGQSVALDGNLALIGARYDKPTGNGSMFTGQGSAYLFDVPTGQQLRKLTAADAAAGDEFGYSVALSNNVALVGARLDGDNGDFSGSAYLFDVTTGQPLFKLLPSNGELFSEFGSSVALSGNFALVGARNHNMTRGAAFVFDVTTGQQIFELTPSDTALGDWFGQSVAISGTIAIVGAIQDSTEHQDGNGAAYLFDLTTGRQLAKLTATDGLAEDNFGTSVALSGNRALIGAGGADAFGNASGAAYVFDIASPVAGDFNGDNLVNAADYMVWRNSLGTSGSGLAADGNGDHLVDHHDYNLWKQNYGQPTAGGLFNPPASVPEPATWLLALCGLVIAARYQLKEY